MAGVAGRWARADRACPPLWPSSVGHRRLGAGHRHRFGLDAIRARVLFEVARHDVGRDDPPPPGSFDLIHARLVLVHVPRARRSPGFHGRGPSTRRVAACWRTPIRPFSRSLASTNGGPNRSWPTGCAAASGTLLVRRGADAGLRPDPAPGPPPVRTHRRVRRRLLPGDRSRRAPFSNGPRSSRSRERMIAGGLATAEEIDRHLANIDAGATSTSPPRR